MALYTRRQLLVLLLLVAGGGGGLAVGRWRRANPDTVDYLEQLDRAPAPPASVAPPQAARVRAARSTADGEPRRARRGRTPRPSSAAAGSLTETEADDLDADRATDAESTSR
jgi:hypothetical protein